MQPEENQNKLRIDFISVIYYSAHIRKKGESGATICIFNSFEFLKEYSGLRFANSSFVC